MITVCYVLHEFNDFTFIIDVPKSFVLYLQLLYQKRSVSPTRNTCSYNSPRPKAAPTPPLWGVWAVLKPSWGRRIQARRFVDYADDDDEDVVDDEYGDEYDDDA